MINKFASFFLMLILLVCISSCSEKSFDNAKSPNLALRSSEVEKSIVNQTIGKLIAMGVDTFIVYEQAVAKDTYSPYIFWVSKGNHFVCSAVSAGSNKAVVMGFSQFVASVVIKFNDIKEAEIKQASHTIGAKVIVPAVEHSRTTSLYIQIGSKVTEKKIDHYDLETRTIDKNTLNDNYLYNQGSILNYLKRIAEHEIETFHRVV